MDAIYHLIEEVRKQDAALGEMLSERTKAFRSPSAVWTELLHDASLAEQAPAAVAEEEEPLASASILDDLKNGLPKAGVALVDFVFGIFAGTYDGDCRIVATSGSSLALYMDEKREAAKPEAMISSMKEIMQGLNKSCGTAVSSVEGAAPQPSFRALGRAVSDPEAETAAKAERESVWRQAQAVRKRWATLAVPKIFSVDGITSSFKQCGPVWQFQGILNENHRLIVASADLASPFEANVLEPWAAAPTVDETRWTDLMAFLKARSGPTDVVIIFDGGCRKARRIAEDAFAGEYEELFLVFTGSRQRAGRSRKTVLAAKLVEVGLVILPCARTRVKIQTREDEFVNCGEDSTFFDTYSGVPFRPTSELPLIESKEKAVVTGVQVPVAPDTWLAKHGSAQPLIWNESKPIKFWRALLQHFSAKVVFDVTAGTGALLEAAMVQGARYHGLCSSAALTQYYSF